ncbi:hypothetical protein Cfor_04621 [Coptotermes formosanus]|uniref:LACTB2 winged helix domain-containing protein n=1 Tax=Coptotermes formosanus TaxID=36987 RepID=A0A6L2PQ31_COPFO|nr:hypothetical protein Cfor_04621 [Coptotermes formosanus]
MNSLHRILELKPTCIYPGHGPVVENPLPKIEYYINHRNKREEEILGVLKEKGTTMSEMDLVKIIYIDTPENLHTAAASNVNHHLCKLLKEKKVLQCGSKWKYNMLASSLLGRPESEGSKQVKYYCHNNKYTSEHFSFSFETLGSGLPYEGAGGDLFLSIFLAGGIFKPDTKNWCYASHLLSRCLCASTLRILARTDNIAITVSLLMLCIP